MNDDDGWNHSDRGEAAREYHGQREPNGSNHQSEVKSERRGPKQADILIELAQSAELFHILDGAGFADLNIKGHRETWPIRSKGFKRWLALRFYETQQSAPNSEALQSALNVIEARAQFSAPEREVYVRVGGFEGRVYLDLADERWRAIEISPQGWRITDAPPVRFRRPAGMLTLPVPVAGDSIESLRPFLNVKTDDDFVLAVSWLFAALRNRGPYPVLVLSGEHGAAKPTVEEILRVGLAAWISDTLCATGGGFAVRQLYTDQDEVLFDAQRPIILNGIEDIITRPDLADRTMFLTLEAIPEDRRQSKEELWAESHFRTRARRRWRPRSTLGIEDGRPALRPGRGGHIRRRVGPAGNLEQSCRRIPRASRRDFGGARGTLFAAP
jgi:hypothetical protein